MNMTTELLLSKQHGWFHPNQLELKTFFYFIFTSCCALLLEL